MIRQTSLINQSPGIYQSGNFLTTVKAKGPLVAPGDPSKAKNIFGQVDGFLNDTLDAIRRREEEIKQVVELFDGSKGTTAENANSEQKPHKSNLKENILKSIKESISENKLIAVAVSLVFGVFLIKIMK